MNWKQPSKNITSVFESPVTTLKEEQDTGKILDTFAAQNNLGRVDEISLRLFRLRATGRTDHPVLATHEFTGESPEKALKGYGKSTGKMAQNRRLFTASQSLNAVTSSPDLPSSKVKIR